MSEHRLAPLPPLGGPVPEIDRIGGIEIAENIGVALASVACRHGREKDFASACEALFGFTLPGTGRVAARGAWCAFWTGPHQWFVEAPFDSHEDIAAIVEAGLGDTASVTEQTDGWVRFDLVGQEVTALLERLCPLDVRKLPIDCARRSMVEHMGCILIRRAEPPCFTLLGPRSFAHSLHHAVSVAAGSVTGLARRDGALRSEPQA